MNKRAGTESHQIRCNILQLGRVGFVGSIVGISVVIKLEQSSGSALWYSVLWSICSVLGTTTFVLDQQELRSFPVSAWGESKLSAGELLTMVVC